MSDTSSDASPQWTDAADRVTLQQRGALAAKLGTRQVALFWHEGQPLACNNRCPHEGYPLCEGHLAEDGYLTCQWHNWKFDLRTGANAYGGDALRVYPARVQGERVQVDLAEPPRAQQVALALARIDEAMGEDDRPRLARELARLHRAGATTDDALAHAIRRDALRWRYGTTHAQAAADAWLQLADRLPASATAERLACGTEALGYLGREVLREREYPFDEGVQPWEPAAFLAAVEAQDEAAAVRRLNGALGAGLTAQALAPTLARAALAHYQDFGHSAIYLTHVLRLVRRLGPSVAAPLLRNWVRSLVFATREDLLPDFRAYAPALQAWAAAAAMAPQRPPESGNFEALTIKQTLQTTLDAAGAPPSVLWAALLQAGAHHLLRYDEHWGQRTDTGVADAIGWLDFSHALTFAHAVRTLCAADPALWPQALLQMALFVGRNTPYLQAGLSSAAALRSWQVIDQAAFQARAIERIVDHGLGVDIFPAHALKTWLAVEEMRAGGLSAPVFASVQAALARLLDARIKQRHGLRLARQSLAFVARED